MYTGSERDLERETERRLEHLDEMAHDGCIQEKFILEDPKEFLSFMWLYHYAAISDYIASNSIQFMDWIMENYEEEL